MASMKIGKGNPSDAQSYAAAAYSFQTNPKVVNIPLEKNDISYSKTETTSRIPFIHSQGIVAPRAIIINGTCYGTTKRTIFRGLQSEIYDNDIKRFWINSTHYYEVMGQNIRETLAGERTNFIDYVGNLVTVQPYLQEATNRTATITITDEGDTVLNGAACGGSPGQFQNTGNAPAFVTWKFVNSSDNIKKIEISDGTIAGGRHILTWKESTGFATANTLEIFPVYYLYESVQGDFKVAEPASPIKSSAVFGSRTIDGIHPPSIDAGSTDQAFHIKINDGESGSVSCVVTATWHYSYTG